MSNKMSTDAVEFVLCRHDIMTSGCPRASIAMETLGLTMQEVVRITQAESFRPVSLRVRPSQFARFLIARNDAGEKNGFKSLCPKLIEVDEPCVIDTRKRDRRDYSC
jgi:hypothetical protein